MKIVFYEAFIHLTSEEIISWFTSEFQLLTDNENAIIRKFNLDKQNEFYDMIRQNKLDGIDIAFITPKMLVQKYNFTAQLANHICRRIIEVEVAF